jgi:hypothetical protein
MPASNQIHQNKPLEGISVAYKNAEYIADKLAPVYPVAHESDTYYVYSKDTLRLPETLRAVGAEAHEGDWNVSTASYLMDEHALKHLVADRQRENADPALDLDVDATEYLTDRILFRREKALIDLVQNNGSWANEMSLAATNTWSLQTTVSNPIPMMDTATAVILQNTGKKPNVCLLSLVGFNAAKENMNITDRVKYTSADSVTEAMLGKLFGIPEVMVSRATQNTSDEGLADSMAFLMTDCAWVGYVEKTPGLRKASALYTFVKGPTPMQVKKYRVEERDGDMIEVSSKFVHKIVASDCGFAFWNVA